MLLRRLLSHHLHRRNYYTKKPFPKKETEEEIVFIKDEILYGIYPVLFALKSGKRIFNQLFYNTTSKRVEDVVALAVDMGVRVVPTSFSALDDLSRRSEKQRGVHQGVCADVTRINMEVCRGDEDTEYESPPLWLVLCGVKDPMNMGSILRSSYYLGVDRVLTTPEYSCSSLSPVVSKASAGVLEVFPPCIIAPTSLDFLNCKVDKGWNVIGTGVVSKSDRFSSTTPKLDRPTILVMGSEGGGIPSELASKCVEFLHLPPGRRDLMPGVDSLNVSVAAALLIHTLKSNANK